MGAVATFCGLKECTTNYTATRMRIAMANPQNGGFFALGVGELPVIAQDDNANDVKLTLK